MMMSSINPQFLKALTILLTSFQVHLNGHLESLHFFPAVHFQLAYKNLGFDIDLRHEPNFGTDDMARYRILLTVDCYLRHFGHLLDRAFHFSRVDLLSADIDDLRATP